MWEYGNWATICNMSLKLTCIDSYLEYEASNHKDLGTILGILFSTLWEIKV